MAISMWFKKYWPTILGVALQAGTLWNFIKWALDWRGRFDALANTYRDVGGYGIVIGFFLEPPPWFYPLAFIAEIVLIWWNLRGHFRPQPPVIKSTEWKKPFEAIESFGDQKLVAAKNKLREELVESVESLYKMDEKISELERKEQNIAGDAPLSESQLLQLRRLKEFTVIGDRYSKDELSRTWAELREDIGKKLESGELAAKGVAAPYIAGKGEAEIAPHEWRLLTIDPVREQAIEKNGGEFKYVGLVIRKGTR